MKKITFIVAFIAATIQIAFAQTASQPTGIITLVSSYMDIKNALVNSDVSITKVKADAFSKLVQSIDVTKLPASETTSFTSFKDKLVADAQQVSRSKTLDQARDSFSSLSTNFYKLAKAVKLSDKPIYYTYCPMKKSYWLSEEDVVKNPYYGKQMLTCGKVVETLNK